MRLVSERGPKKASVAAITRAAGVSNALFYWYFADVETLVREALAEGVDAIRMAVAGALAGVDDPLDRVERRLRVVLRLMEDDERVAFLLRADASGWLTWPEFAAVTVGGEDVMFDIVRDVAEGQAHDDVRDDVPAFLLASCVRSVFADTVARHIRGQTRVPLDASVDAVIAFVRQGLADPARIAGAGQLDEFISR
jgi:AcrR family transcriptional regulator